MPEDPYGTNGGGTTGEIPTAVRQQVASEGINPYSPEGEARARQIMAEQKAISDIAGKIPAGWQQIDATHWLNPANGRVNELRATSTGAISWDEYPAKESAAYLNSVGTGGGGSGGSAGGSTARLASDDPRYWANQDRQFALDVATLEAQLQNMGLDAESARRQALTTLITNRNNTAVDVGNLSLTAAKTAAEFAANPRDAVAELMYRNQVGGNAFGDMTNDKFGEYGKALADKAAQIFSPVQADINQARLYRDAIPPVDFYGPEQRTALGLPPTPAQQLQGSVGVAAPQAAGTPPPVNGLQALMDRLNSFSPQKQADFQNYVTGGKAKAVPGMAKGGQLNLDSLFNSVDKPGESPIDTEGGLNINLNERAVLITESGKPLAIFGERRPDGTIRREQIITKPLKSEVEKDKKLAEAGKAAVETKKQTLAAFAGGGQATITAGQSPDDFMEQLSTYLGSLGGSGGGTGGYKTPLPSLRLLAGAPANALEDDPVAQDYALAGYSALGIDPRTVAAQIKKFSPTSAQRVGQTNVRSSFL